MVSVSSGWDWFRLRRLVPDHILEFIVIVLPPSANARSDRLSWKWMTKDSFSSSKTYRNMHRFEEDGSSNIWKLIWNAKRMGQCP